MILRQINKFVILFMSLGYTSLTLAQRLHEEDCLKLHTSFRASDQNFCRFSCVENLPDTVYKWHAEHGYGPMMIYNLGGEGEFGIRSQQVINFQLPHVLNPGWKTSRLSISWEELVSEGNAYNQEFRIIDDMSKVPGDAGSVDLIYTNSVPLDQQTRFGPGPATENIVKLLREGGLWIKDQKAYIKRNDRMWPYH